AAGLDVVARRAINLVPRRAIVNRLVLVPHPGAEPPQLTVRVVRGFYDARLVARPPVGAEAVRRGRRARPPGRDAVAGRARRRFGRDEVRRAIRDERPVERDALEAAQRIATGFPAYGLQERRVVERIVVVTRRAAGAVRVVIILEER